jgi:hypothetical protein
MQTISKKNLISFRSYLPGDLHFILSTWLRGLYYGNDYFREIEDKVYFKNYENIIKHILAKPSVRIDVACLKEDDSVILGYTVTEKKDDKNILHWVFVKNIWRGIGISKDLLDPLEIKTTTHITNKSMRTKPKRIEFNPFII